MSKSDIQNFLYQRNDGELITLARIYGSKARTLRGMVAFLRRRLASKGTSL